MERAQDSNKPASPHCLQTMVPGPVSLMLTPVLKEPSLFPNTFVIALCKALGRLTTRFSHNVTQRLSAKNNFSAHSHVNDTALFCSM